MYSELKEIYKNPKCNTAGILCLLFIREENIHKLM